MKRITKRDIFVFLLGLILSGSVVYAATFIAKDVTYDNSKSSINANNVQDAIDALYTKANEGAPESYTGSYTYTPSTNTQTIYSANKRFNDNITINPIPSSYKNLSYTTTVNANNLLNGITAYNNNGELITGNISTDCVSGTFLCNNNCANGKYNFIDFKPSFFSLTFINNGTRVGHLYYLPGGFITFSGSAISYKGSSYEPYTISSTQVIINGLGNNWLNKTVYYTACK